ncbi:MJ1255/VC2487 family glycosyltransferase [Methanobrevibacter sp.]|uniref:MJ1255/VC2487 family glycosyltransferase n=1 Tax=Methanobrevibacter sp. TaxID=66852 RepID=UPI0025DF4486|nr:MJ1255/VC2487 family glycosyltransferase [Methanobrevibacter sp.]MBQ2962634.1 glycosyltransferase [Methanobrevibacter sp.]
MKISIIIPTYNEEEYLPKLLESIKSQDFTDYEVIVADAQSNDNTREIAAEYGCTVVEGGLPGPGRNRGAEVAQGEILLFLDSDLKLTENYLRDVIEEFEREELGIAITQMTPLSEKKRDKYLHDLANWFMIAVENIKPHGAGCYGIISKKELHEEVGGFDENLSFGEDTDYIERVAEISEFKVLRNARIGVSTRRLEEEGLYTLLKQYGKSTVNDFRGKRTSAEDLGYEFGHDPISALDSTDMERIAEKSRNRKIKDRINRFKDKEPEENELIEVQVSGDETTFIGIDSQKAESLDLSKSSDTPLLESGEENGLISLEDAIAETGRKRIFYSICGEGMGHAIRSSVILEHLIEKYDVYIFSSERAYEFLSKKFDNVYEIGGFNTVYENNVVRTKKTFFKALKANPTNLKEGYNVLYKECKKVRPNIIISDFENYSSMLSKLMNIPLISLDNIHMLTQCEYDYPPHHRADMLTAKAVTKSYILRPKRHIITTFFYPPLKHPKMTALYPPVLREEIMELEPEQGNHVLVYQTAESSINLMEELKKLNDEFIVYGFNKDEIDENLTYRSFNEEQIFEDMRTAKAIIVNGGFTMISEAIYLKKPIYSTPAHKNFEQILNGFYVEKLGFGEYHDDLDVEKIENFLNNLDKYQENLNKVKPWDNSEILEDLDLSIEKYSRLY